MSLSLSLSLCIRVEKYVYKRSRPARVGRVGCSKLGPKTIPNGCKKGTNLGVLGLKTLHFDAFGRGIFGEVDVLDKVWCHFGENVGDSS